jgi:hypothetical protein
LGMPKKLGELDDVFGAGISAMNHDHRGGA